MANQSTPRLFLIFWLVLLASSCGGGGGGGGDVPEPVPQPPTPVFEAEGLDGLTIARLYQQESQLYAATDNGVYRKAIGEFDWQPIGLTDRNVFDLAFVDDQHWVAATTASGANPFLDPKLFETVNDGSNWQEVINNFGGQTSQSESMYALAYDAVGQQLFATGAEAFARSTDLGRNWELLDGIWDAVSQPLDALRFDRANNQVWFGGQNAIEEMTLRRYDLTSGQTDSYPGLLPSPSTIKGVTLAADGSNRVLASGEGGILFTQDNGGAWTVILRSEESRFYFQTAFDPDNGQVIYTGSWEKIFVDPQPLVFEVSRDGGGSWEMYTLDDPQLFGGIWSVLATTENGVTVVYLGLYRGGIMKVRFTES